MAFVSLPSSFNNKKLFCFFLFFRFRFNTPRVRRRLQVAVIQRCRICGECQHHRSFRTREFSLDLFALDYLCRKGLAGQCLGSYQETQYHVQREARQEKHEEKTQLLIFNSFVHNFDLVSTFLYIQFATRLHFGIELFAIIQSAAKLQCHMHERNRDNS